MPQHRQWIIAKTIAPGKKTGSYIGPLSDNTGVPINELHSVTKGINNSWPGADWKATIKAVESPGDDFVITEEFQMQSEPAGVVVDESDEGAIQQFSLMEQAQQYRLQQERTIKSEQFQPPGTPEEAILKNQTEQPVPVVDTDENPTQHSSMF